MFLDCFYDLLEVEHSLGSVFWQLKVELVHKVDELEHSSWGHLLARQVGAWESRSGWNSSGSDMYLSQHTPRAARLAAGGIVALTTRVCTVSADSPVLRSHELAPNSAASGC